MKIDWSRLTPDDIVKAGRWRPSPTHVKRAAFAWGPVVLLWTARALDRGNRAWLAGATYDALYAAVGASALLTWATWPDAAPCNCPPGLHDAIGRVEAGGARFGGIMIKCPECNWMEEVDDPATARARAQHHHEFDCPERHDA